MLDAGRADLPKAAGLSAMGWDYLERNNRFYSTFWRDHPLYCTRYPNADEVERAALVIRFLSRLRETVPVETAAPRILDVGCGRGWLTSMLAMYGPSEGCEPTLEAVALARAMFPGIVFHACTLGELAACPDFAPFDVVVCSEVLEHVPDSLKGAFVSELAAGLAAGGHCIITTPRAEMWKRCGDSSGQMIEDWLTEDELEREFTTRGLVPVWHDRGSAAGGSVADRLLARARRAVGPKRLRTSFDVLQRGLDYRSAMYQAWCFRK